MIEKYFEVAVSEALSRHEKEFSRRMISGLSEGYRQEKKEPSLVRIVEYVVNSVGSFSSKPSQPYFGLSTKSVFIHGQKSQVQFEYYGKKTNSIELGDLVFIISIVFNRKKYLERLTINQFKRAPQRKRAKPKATSWSISNRKQLYLLSRFPVFTGVKGLIPRENFSLTNHSGCLGSYGLLHEPGDFAFVSATRLDSYLGGRSSLRRKELHRLEKGELGDYYGWMTPFPSTAWWIFGNCQFSHNVHRFSYHYLRMNIGEPVYSKIGLDNPSARELLEQLMTAIGVKARKEKSRPILSFLTEFNRFPYADKEDRGQSDRDMSFDSEGGGLGIIYTCIDLGE